MFLDISRDALGDELTTDDISKRETALDMELIKLIGKACSSSKDRPARPVRALDLARMIHNPAILDSAIKVAQFYKLRGLEDRMNQLKASRADDDRLYMARERRREWAGDVAPIPAPHAPTYIGLNANGPRPFEDFNPPPAVPRPGLTRAVPTTQSSAATPSSSSFVKPTYSWDETSDDVEPKRKRTPEDDAPASDPKRRAVQPNGAPAAASKQSTPGVVGASSVGVLMRSLQRQTRSSRSHQAHQSMIDSHETPAERSRRVRASSTRSRLLNLALVEVRLHTGRVAIALTPCRHRQG
jgi:chromosome transmission fidelity protein 4